MHEGTDGGAASFAPKLGNVGGEGHEHAHEEKHGRPDNVAPKGDPGEVLGTHTAPRHHRIEHPHAHLRQLGGHGGQGQATSVPSSAVLDGRAASTGEEPSAMKRRLGWTTHPRL